MKTMNETKQIKLLERVVEWMKNGGHLITGDLTRDFKNVKEDLYTMADSLDEDDCRFLEMYCYYQEAHGKMTQIMSLTIRGLSQVSRGRRFIQN